MKRNNDIRDVIYVHVNEKEHFVYSYGIEFREFYQFLSETISSILLLKHRFDDGEFHLHTQLEYVPKHKLGKLSKEDVYGYGDFAWIDFGEAESLDVLEGQTIAELLYLGHKFEHLKAPFFQSLGNQYVYLAHDDGWFNKTYYKNLDAFYYLLSQVIASKVSNLKTEKLLIGLKKKRVYPSIPTQAFASLKKLMKEGIVLSIQKATQNRARIEIPIWMIGDFANMDDMYEEYENKSKKNADAKLIFDKKTKEWQVVVL